MKWIRKWLLKRHIKKVRKLLKLIDEGIKKVGMPRHERKRLWRDFIKDKENHEAILELLEVK